jgi:hypothetical protein
VAVKKSAAKRIITVLTVADLHQSQELYQQLTFAVAEHRPDVVALVGDCLHSGDDMNGRLAVADCALALCSLRNIEGRDQARLPRYFTPLKASSADNTLVSAMKAATSA